MQTMEQSELRSGAKSSTGGVPPWSGTQGPLGPTIPEHNQKATLYLQELTSTLLIQRLTQVHGTLKGSLVLWTHHPLGPWAPLHGGNTSHDYQGFQQFFSIYKFP